MYKLTNSGIVTKDGMSIPNDMGNRHWVKYQAWLGEGNTPLPADPEPAPEEPESTVADMIDALSEKDLGDDSKWKALQLKRLRKVQND